MKQGFTVIEFLIVVCIIGILWIIGYGSFQDYLERQQNEPLPTIEQLEPQPPIPEGHCYIIRTDDYGYEQERIAIDCNMIPRG